LGDEHVFDEVTDPITIYVPDASTATGYDEGKWLLYNIEIKTTPTPPSGGSGGCDAGLGAGLSLLGLALFAATRKKKTR
jgi:hypothetical protein